MTGPMNMTELNERLAREERLTRENAELRRKHEELVAACRAAIPAIESGVWTHNSSAWIALKALVNGGGS